MNKKEADRLRKAVGGEFILYGTDTDDPLCCDEMHAKLLLVSDGGRFAKFVSFGLTADEWPGNGPVTQRYALYFGKFASAVSGVHLPCVGAYLHDIDEESGDVLQALKVLSYAAGHNHFPYLPDAAWTSTELDGDVWNVYANNGKGHVGKAYPKCSNLVIAPVFTLDLFKVTENAGVFTVLDDALCGMYAFPE